jgi:PilZ domain/GYF domain 2
MKHESSSEHDITEWYVLKGEIRFGPFDYAEVVRMLQDKIVFNFDYGWHAGLSGWKRLVDIAEFQESAIRQFSENRASKTVFAERKHPRHAHKGTLIIHDQQNWWHGQAFEISSGGVGVVMNNAMMVPGQKVHLHFKPHGHYPAFNAIGEIVSKKYMDNVKEREAPIQYGVRFLSVSGGDKDKLLNMLKESA